MAQAVKNKANDRTFPNAKAVSEYLSESGWKIGKTQVYEHVKGRKLRPKADGLFYERDVNHYAQRFLRRIDASGKQSPELEKVQERRVRAEAAKMEAQAEHWRIKTQRESEALVPRDEFERALAARAMVFRTDLENFCYSEVGNFISVCRGDPQASPEVIQFMLDRFSVFLTRYADSEKQWEALIPPAGDPGDESSLDEDDDEGEDELESSPGPGQGPAKAHHDAPKRLQ